MNLSPTTVLAWGALLSALAVVLATTEAWAIREQFDAGGVLSTDVVRQVGNTSYTYRRKALPINMPYVSMSWLLLLEIGSASIVAVLALLVMLGAPGLMVNILWLAVVVASMANLAASARTPAGQDGADQMASIVLLVCAIGLAPGLHPVVAVAAVWFIALQACLAYETAGIAKLVSSDWRSGEAIRLVFRTSSYGNAWIRQRIAKHRFLPKAMCFSVIAGECLFPVATFLGGPFLLLALTWGLAFHISVVAIMRLNTFVLAFPATYGALCYVGL